MELEIRLATCHKHNVSRLHLVVKYSMTFVWLRYDTGTTMLPSTLSACYVRHVILNSSSCVKFTTKKYKTI